MLSTTFDKYCYVNVRHLPPFFSYATELSYAKTERVNSLEEIEHPAIRNAMKMLDMHHIRLTYEADLPARSGLGTSSSFAVGMLNAFYALKGQYASKEKLAKEAIYLERVLCAEAGGWQDQIAAAFGGFNRIDFSADGYEVRPVLLSPERKRRLNGRLMMFFTGFTRFSAEIQQLNNSRNGADKLARLQEMLALVDEAEAILTDEQADLNEFGRLLDHTWKLKRGTGAAVSTDCIDALYARGIAALAGDLPKPMRPIDGRPVLERELGSLREQGVTDVLITVGHLAPAIMEYFGDGSGYSPQTGRPFGVHIEYFVEKEPLGNAGALFRIRDRLDEDFLLLNGDVMFDVDLQRFAAFHKVHGGLATLFTHPNGHPYDSGLIVADSEQRVTQWLTKEDARPQYYRNRVNAGLHILSPKLLEGNIPAGKVDLDRQILKPLAGTGQLLCYDSPEYVKDMGTPERYAAVCEDVRSGHAAARNLRRKQKAIFLDRDGTINRYVGFLRNIDEFELLPGVAQVVRKINELGWLAVVVTNQPVIARGEVTEEQLEAIHCKMETLLGREGAWLDAIYYCPHHPDKGFPGERPELKIHCSCRKPAPGMLLDAAQRLNIDLSRSWMVGDGKNDVLAGKNAGCRTALLCADGTPPELGPDLIQHLQKALPAIAMDGHPALTTAYANDCAPLMCFAQQVNGYGRAGDVLLVISTSGKSKNILYAAVTARALGMKVVGLTGGADSPLLPLCDVCIRVPLQETYQIQELHLPIYHCLCLMLEEHFFDE